jgi:uncharacterized protein YceK
MKRVVLILMAGLMFNGCARVWVRQDMQQDKSYKIEVSGNGFTSLDTTKEEAYRRASLLCRNGYQTNSDIPDDAVKPSYTLVVVCK